MRGVFHRRPEDTGLFIKTKSIPYSPAYTYTRARTHVHILGRTNTVITWMITLVPLPNGIDIEKEF